MFIVVTKDAQGAPAVAYRGPHQAKAEAHKKELLAAGQLAIVEEVADEKAE